jgi:hypothetical protein
MPSALPRVVEALRRQRCGRGRIVSLLCSVEPSSHSSVYPRAVLSASLCRLGPAQAHNLCSRASEVHHPDCPPHGLLGRRSAVGHGRQPPRRAARLPAGAHSSLLLPPALPCRRVSPLPPPPPADVCSKLVSSPFCTPRCAARAADGLSWHAQRPRTPCSAQQPRAAHQHKAHEHATRASESHARAGAMHGSISRHRQAGSAQHFSISIRRLDPGHAAVLNCAPAPVSG